MEPFRIWQVRKATFRHCSFHGNGGVAASVVASVVASVAAVTVDGVATVAGVGEGAVASRNAASTASIDSSDSPSKSKYIAANDRFGKIDVSVHD